MVIQLYSFVKTHCVHLQLMFIVYKLSSIKPIESFEKLLQAIKNSVRSVGTKLIYQHPPISPF